MSDGKKLFPATRLILIAAAAGAVAGAVAVYVRGNPSGNNPTPPASVVAATPEDKACAVKADKGKALADAAVGEVAAMLPADPPQSLRGLAFSGPDGKPMTLADRAGKTLLVNLWATWCAPCRAEMPALDALQKEMGGEQFEVVAVNVDVGDAAKPQKFLAETGVTALVPYRDASMGVFEELKKRGLAFGLPVTLLVDPEGCLLANMNGPAEWSSDDAKRFIGVALGGEGSS
jgi:thiol-disulfide isomerase/thioredoxin